MILWKIVIISFIVMSGCNCKDADLDVSLRELAQIEDGVEINKAIDIIKKVQVHADNSGSYGIQYNAKGKSVLRALLTVKRGGALCFDSVIVIKAMLENERLRNVEINTFADAP